MKRYVWIFYILIIAINACKPSGRSRVYAVSDHYWWKCEVDSRFPCEVVLIERKTDRDEVKMIFPPRVKEADIFVYEAKAFGDYAKSLHMSEPAVIMHSTNREKKVNPELVIDDLKDGRYVVQLLSKYTKCSFEIQVVTKQLDN